MKTVIRTALATALLTLFACSTKTVVQSPSPTPVVTVTDSIKAVIKDTVKTESVIVKPVEPVEVPAPVEVPKMLDAELVALRAQGDSLYKAGNFEEAFPVWTLILKTAPDKTTTAIAHYVRGTIYSHDAEYDPAKSEFRKAIAADSMLLDSYQEVGLVHFAIGAYDSALISFKEVLRYSPKDSDATYWIEYTKGQKAYEEGLADLINDNPDHAIVNLQIAAKYRDLDTAYNYKIYFFLGKSYLEKPNYDSALYFLNRAVKVNPNMHEGYTEIGSVHFAKQDFAKAIQFNQKALSIEPTFGKAINNLGYIYFTMANNFAVNGDKVKANEQYAKAIEQFEKAIEADPSIGGPRKNLEHVKKIMSGTRNVVAYTLLQSALTTEDNVDKILQYRKIIHADPTYDDAYVNLGVALYYEGKVDSGMMAVRKAIAINPFNPQAHNNLGYMLATAHRWDEALQHITTAFKIKRDYFDAYVNLGYLYMWKEDFVSSRKVWNQLIKLNPKNILARKGLEEMERREKMIKAGETTTTIIFSDDPDDTDDKKN